MASQVAGVQLWAYRDPAHPGIFVIPPPLYQPSHPVGNESHQVPESEEDQSSLFGLTHRIRNTLHRVTFTVPNGFRAHNGSRTGRGETMEDQTDEDGIAAQSSQSHSDPLVWRWPSVSQHGNLSVESDHGHDTQEEEAEEVDDSFFLHGTERLADPQNPFFPPRIKSPVLVDLKPSADYAKMMDSSSSSEPDTSIKSYISQLSQLMKDVNELPWSSSRPTADYYPGRGHRRFHFEPYFEADRNSMSWYALLRRRRYIDLLSSDSESSRSRSPPPNSALADQPNLPYAYGEPNTHRDQSRRPSQDSVQTNYPHGFAPQLTVVEPPPRPHIPPSSTPIFGPRIPGQILGNQYSYPPSWPPPLLVPARNQ